MREIASIAVESIAREKVRHASNAVATTTAATVGEITGGMGEVLVWLPYVAGLLVSCALFYKTYLEIRLAKIALAKEGRRKTDKRYRHGNDYGDAE